MFIENRLTLTAYNYNNGLYGNAMNIFRGLEISNTRDRWNQFLWSQPSRTLFVKLLTQIERHWKMFAHQSIYWNSVAWISIVNGFSEKKLMEPYNWLSSPFLQREVYKRTAGCLCSCWALGNCTWNALELLKKFFLLLSLMVSKTFIGWLADLLQLYKVSRTTTKQEAII